MTNSDRSAPVLRNRNGLPPAVLLVEDETLVAYVLQHLLEDLGCQVVGWALTASDAERLAARTFNKIDPKRTCSARFIQ